MTIGKIKENDHNKREQSGSNSAYSLRTSPITCLYLYAIELQCDSLSCQSIKTLMNRKS